MSNFIKIVKNYQNVCRLGQKIIDHKDFIRHVPPDKLSEEFKKQEERIEEFINAINDANDEWEKHPCTINTYWTGLS